MIKQNALTQVLDKIAQFLSVAITIDHEKSYEDLNGDCELYVVISFGENSEVLPITLSKNQLSNNQYLIIAILHDIFRYGTVMGDLLDTLTEDGA